MRAAIKRCSFLAGLVVFAATFVGDRQARAGGITITSATAQPIGGSLVDYVFEVQLTSGTLFNGGFFTVYDLPGVTLTSATAAPNSFWGYSIQPTGITPPLFQPPLTPPIDTSLENVTWVYRGFSTSETTIGEFRVEATGPLPSSLTLTYVGTLDGTTATTEAVITVAAVPEPSSVFLLLIAAALLPLHVCRMQRSIGSRQGRAG